jgi:hypothetical protein
MAITAFALVFIGSINISANNQNSRVLYAYTSGGNTDTNTKFNDDSLDFDTVRVSNYTKFPNSTDDWHANIDADAGDVVSVAVYYHNTGSVDAENVTISMSMPGNTGTDFTVDGGVSADNANSVFGGANIHLSSTQSLTYISGSTRWYSNQTQSNPASFLNGQTGDEVISGGVSIGNIAPGWSTQGSVVARFQVSNNSSAVDIKANGSDGPITLGDKEPITLNWTSNGVSNCVLKIDGEFRSGVFENGDTGPFDYTHPYYPTMGGQKEYTFECQAQSGSLISDSVIVKRLVEAPGAPYLYAQVSGQCGGLINLWWEDVSGADGYNLYRDGKFIASTTKTNFTDSGLIPFEHYSYIVRSFNQRGESVDSNTAIGQASTECPAFTQGPVLNAVTDSSCGGRILLSWADLPGAVEYIVARGGVAIYQGSATSTVDFGLIPGNEYSYAVVALDSDGEYSPSSNVAKAFASAACAQAPSAPIISARTSSQCGGQIDLSWNQVNGATIYEIYRNGAKIGQTSSNSFTDSQLNTGEEYSYKVRAGNSIGFSAFSNISSATSSGACQTVPEAPVLGASTGSECGGQVILTWNQISAAQGYKVFRNGSQIATTSNTTYTDTSLTPSTSYSYTVRSFNNIGESVDSNIANTTSSEGCAEVPMVTLTADPSTIFKGQNSTLYWTSTNANSCEASWTSSKNTSGSQEVSPETTTEYSIKCKSDVGEASTSVTITVLPPVVCSLPEINSSLEASTRLGEMFNYAITTTDLGTSTVFNVDENSLPSGLSFSVDTISGVPTETGTFSVKITAENSCGKTEVTLIITVSGGGGSGGPSMGTITICKLITDDKGQIATSSIGLSEGLFEIIIKNSTSTTNELFNVSFNSLSYTPITEIFDGQMAQCASLAVPLGDYYYERESIVGNNWLEPLYNDEFSVNSDNLSDLFAYSPELFDTNQNNDGNRNIKSDGLVTLRDLTANKVLVVRNSYKFSTSSEPISVTLSADPTTISKGQNSTLSWMSQNATNCSAPWTSATSTNGTQIVTPDSTTSYTISCTGQSGTASSTATVTVTTGGGGNNNPTVSISADPQTINPGATSTLIWTSTNTNSCSAIWTLATSTSGSFSISPSATTDYGITCSGAGGNASATTTVTVTTGGGGGNNPTVSISANPSTIEPGATSTLTWTSTNTNSCSATWTSATSTSGSFDVSPISTTDYGIICTGTGGSASATTTVTIATSNDGGGGGGSSSGGGGSHRSGDRNRPISGVPSTPQVLGATSCEYLKDFLRIDWDNDPGEVIKLQVFLRNFEGFGMLPITAKFDQATFDAVSIFQERYFNDILAPWGHEHSTGFVYITTRKKVNEIVCQRAFPITPQQEEEITLFHQFLDILRSQGIATDGFIPTDSGLAQSLGSIDGSWSGVGLSLSEARAQAQKTITEEKSDDGGGLLSDLAKNKKLAVTAAAIFAGPQSARESLAAIISLFIILGIIYLAVRAVLRRQQSQALPQETKRIKQITYFIIGIVVALVFLSIVEYFVIVLPLLILLVLLALSLIYISLGKKEPHALMRVD